MKHLRLSSLKQALTTDIVLAFPNFKTFYLATDASDYSTGGTLQQRDDEENLRPITYFSWTEWR